MPAVKPYKKFIEYLDPNTNTHTAQSYFAGLPGYPRNFSRDNFTTGILALDRHILQNQVQISQSHQGMQNDPITGEEPGKIHHEWPGVQVHAPYLSTYNACDTTALYLLGLEMLHHFAGKESYALLRQYRHSMEAAISYIIKHTKDDIFWEFPPPGATGFSLYTTYWKDSVKPTDPKKGEEPSYPVAFALVQFQTARGLLAAANILQDTGLRHQADRMFRKGILTFIREDAFCVEIDKRGRLEQASSDELHALAYIPTNYKPYLPLKIMQERARSLITPAGIACTPKEIAEKMDDTYHGYVVWMFEQAFIHYGCTKFGLMELAKVTRRCIPHIDEGQELVTLNPITPHGNAHQLWSVAAGKYFSNKYLNGPSLRRKKWL